MEPSPLPKDFKGAQIYFKDPTPGDVKDSGYYGERPAKDGRDLLVVQVVEPHRLKIQMLMLEEKNSSQESSPKTREISSRG